MKDLISSILPYSTLRYLSQKFSRKRNSFFLQNINWQPNNPYQKRLLFSYIFVHLERKLTQHGSRAQECSLILNGFISKGFCIDLIDYRDAVSNKNIEGRKYDLTFGFGIGFNHVVKHASTIQSILYLTEKYPTFSYEKELERLNYFEERHHRKVKLSRSFLNYNVTDFKNVDKIIFIGNPSESSLIPVDVKKYAIKPTGLINSGYVSNKRILEHTRNRFLWFGSNGAIHKGLDLLIDVFKNRKDCTLLICGLGQLDKKILPNFSNSDNILDLGYLNVHSENYIDLVNDCSFIIMPSCSEGISTGVITCMNHGLIPILTEETGIILNDFGFLLNDFKLNTIETALDWAKGLDNNQLENQHDKVLEYSLMEFSLNKFETRFSEILASI